MVEVVLNKYSDYFFKNILKHNLWNGMTFNYSPDLKNVTIKDKKQLLIKWVIIQKQ